MNRYTLRAYVLFSLVLIGCTQPLYADLKANYAGISYTTIHNDYHEYNGWGLYMSLDIKDCDPQLIRSADAIYQYIVQLCELIKMKRYGEPWIHHFGEAEEVAGLTMMQPIETSLISGHFANATNAIYIDVFSCKLYDPYALLSFTKEYFKGGDADINVHIRR